MRVIAALLCAVVVCAEEAPSRKPETEWLKSSLLLQWCEALGYTVTKNEALDAVELKIPSGNIIFAEFADNDSLKLASSWDSTQKKLGDAPIANGWNNERRFCKISITEKPDDSGTLMLMHFDQLLPTLAGQDAVHSVVKKAITLFETGVAEFDMFSKDTYRAWSAAAKARETEEED